jgi:putative flippase GtrA
MLSRLSRDSSKDYQQSLRVIGRFCTIVLFFACWAAVRHWPHPLYPLSNMLRVAFAACVAFALLRREAFADTSLNYWDEALGYIATAALLDAV